MHKGFRFIAVVLLVMFLWTGGAWAQELPDAVQAIAGGAAEIAESYTAGSMQMYTLNYAGTGEVLLVTCGADGGVIFAETQQSADYNAGAAAVERVRAEELIHAAYPESRILFAADAESGRRLGVAGDDFCGSIVVADDKIISRSLQTGEIFRDGRLTMDGALRVLKLHRPEAEFRALELDEDDGIYVYEGEALISGVVYEFELDVSSGRLLEWERD